MQKKDFGSDFHWGVSTAAYQIEGAHNIDGKGPSIWDDFTQKKGKVYQNQHGNIACDHYNKIDEDINLIKTLNIPNYRFSIAWSRILPEGTGKVNPEGIAFYDCLIDSLLEKGITPWITLYHWDLPLALHKKGGWTNREILNWFTEYTTLVIKHFGDRVKNWMVLNEPMVFTGTGYFLGVHAPGKKGIKNFIPAMHHACLAQGLGGRLLRSLLPDANIGTTYSCSYVTPYNNKPKHILTAKKTDALLNRLYIEPVMGLGYPVDELPILKRVEKYLQPNDEKDMAFDFDFIGIQNYTREVAKYAWYVPYLRGKLVTASKRTDFYTTMGWEVYPDSIYKMLKQFSQYDKNKTLLVTENGAAFPDELTNNSVHDAERTKYLQDYIQKVLQAKQEGVKVNGYFVWTLLDNFEWSEGYSQRFGLVHTNFENQNRTIKNSGLWYKEFLK